MRTVLLAIILILAFPANVAAQVPSPVPATYQITWRKVAESNGISAFIYADDTLQCVVFRELNTGLAPTCFDRKPTEAAPVQFGWVTKAQNGGGSDVHVYHYLDGVAKCVVFEETGLGVAPICIDRRISQE